MPANKKENGSETLVGEIVRGAPEERYFEREVLQPAFSRAQMSIVMNRTPEYAIKKRQGPGGKLLSYVKHGYVTDTLNKAFGFDWDLTLLEIEEGKMYSIQIEEVPITKNGKPTGEVKQTRHVAVCGRLTVRVRDKSGKVITTISKDGFGSQLWLPGVEFGDALKAARSDLVKTCANQLGIALDLYWDDDAEMEAYRERMQEIANEKIEAEKAAEEAIAMLSKPPENIATFFSRCLNDYNVTAADLEKELGISVETVASATPEFIRSLWDKVVSFYGPRTEKEKK